jgi:hypothetical protein
MARWTASFCSGDGRQAGLLYLAAGYRDTTLEEVKAVRYRVHGLTLVQSTRLTAQVTAYLKKLGVKPPPRVLSIESSSATP